MKKDILLFLENKNESKIFEIKEKREKSIRSIRQNDYWHGVICKYVGEYMGENNIARHKALKVLLGIDTTTDLDTAEFATMCKIVITLFKEQYNVKIPLPREDEDMKYYEKYLF